MRNKNQHYVPRGYLARFVDRECEPNREPHLWVVERDMSQPRRGVPRKEAVANYYYTYFSPEDARDDSADELLQVLENAGLPVLRRLENGTDPRDLSPEEKRAASHLIGAMAVRVPSFRDNATQGAQELARLQLQMTAAHPDLFEAAMERVHAIDGTVPRDAASVRKFMLRGDYSIKVNPSWSLQQMLRLQPLGAMYAFNYSWRVLQCPAGLELVTSDDPFVLVSTLARSPAQRARRRMGVAVHGSYPTAWARSASAHKSARAIRARGRQ